MVLPRKHCRITAKLIVFHIIERSFYKQWLGGAKDRLSVLTVFGGASALYHPAVTVCFQGLA